MHFRTVTYLVTLVSLAFTFTPDEARADIQCPNVINLTPVGYPEWGTSVGRSPAQQASTVTAELTSSLLRCKVRPSQTIRVPVLYPNVQFPTGGETTRYIDYVWTDMGVLPLTDGKRARATEITWAVNAHSSGVPLSGMRVVWDCVNRPP